MNPLAILPYINIITAVFAVLCTVGGFFAFRNGRQGQLTKFQEAATAAQSAANMALQQRVEALEGQIEDDAKEKAMLRQNIELIIDTFEKRGITISIDGDIVTIADKSGVTMHRRRRSTIKKAEDSA